MIILTDEKIELPVVKYRPVQDPEPPYAAVWLLVLFVAFCFALVWGGAVGMVR